MLVFKESHAEVFTCAEPCVVCRPGHGCWALLSTTASLFVCGTEAVLSRGPPVDVWGLGDLGTVLPMEEWFSCENRQVPVTF